MFLNFVKSQNEINRASAVDTASARQGARSNNSITLSPPGHGVNSGTTSNTELIAIGGSTVENDDDKSGDDDFPIDINLTQVSYTS